MGANDEGRAGGTVRVRTASGTVVLEPGVGLPRRAVSPGASGY